MSYAVTVSKNTKVISIASKIATSGLNRRKIFPIALAFAMSTRCDVPVTPVNSEEDFFRMNYSSNMKYVFSEINELVPLDLTKAENYTLKFFLQRFSTCYRKTSPIIALPTDQRPYLPVLSLFNISQHFPTEVLDEIMNDAGNFILSIDACLKLIKEICDIKADDIPAFSTNRGVFDTE